MAQLDADLFRSVIAGEHSLRWNTRPRHPLTADEDALAALVRR
jgi:hypothetical protein